MSRRYERAATAPPTPPRVVLDHCFKAVLRVLQRNQYESPDGACIEAAVLLRECLRRRGINAELVRREMSGGRGGHWTVETPWGEVDPTCAFWPKGDRPKDAEPGALYVVRRGRSPHGKWRRTAVDVDRAYAVAWSPHVQRRRG